MVWPKYRPIKAITPELGLSDKGEKDLTDATRSFMRHYADALPEEADAELRNPVGLPYRLSRDFLDRHGARFFRHSKRKWPQDSVYLVRRVAEILIVQYASLLDYRRRKRPVSDVDDEYGDAEDARVLRSRLDANVTANDISERSLSRNKRAVQGPSPGVDFTSKSRTFSPINKPTDQETYTIPESPTVSEPHLPSLSHIFAPREHTPQPPAEPKEFRPASPTVNQSRPTAAAAPNSLNDSLSAYFTPTIPRRPRPRPSSSSTAEQQPTRATRKTSNLTDETCSTSASDTPLQRVTQPQVQTQVRVPHPPTFTVRCGNQRVAVSGQTLAHVLQSTIARLEWQRAELSLVMEDGDSRVSRSQNVEVETDRRALAWVSELLGGIEMKLARDAV